MKIPSFENISLGVNSQIVISKQGLSATISWNGGTSEALRAEAHMAGVWEPI